MLSSHLVSTSWLVASATIQNIQCMGEIVIIIGGVIVVIGALDATYIEDGDEWKPVIKKIALGIFVIGAGLVMRLFGV
jgi:hypothetical protein